MIINRQPGYEIIFKIKRKSQYKMSILKIELIAVTLNKLKLILMKKILD